MTTFLNVIDAVYSNAYVTGLKVIEGLVLHAYADEGGTRTIGYGHTGGVRAGEEITATQADELLQGDLNHCLQAVRRNVKLPVTQGELDVFCDFVFNDGEAALERSTFLRKFNAGDNSGAVGELAGWVYVNHKPDRGLMNRAKWRARMWVGNYATQ